MSTLYSYVMPVFTCVTGGADVSGAQLQLRAQKLHLPVVCIYRNVSLKGG